MDVRGVHRRVSKTDLVFASTDASDSRPYWILLTISTVKRMVASEN
ncbi:hypothetical protein Q31b_03860 [Novipirellula aureliae]|uniref:Uncharacterized protein n=1 Tax=Novipirellula aureliae TaxID=2527966 RepID=A0A5C6E9M0_9BACT|nr:hypothetical protein Q31b_03860 [Novipirellula aureliae]